MSKAPKRIWTTGNDHTGSWNNHEIDHLPQAEYLRADLHAELVKAADELAAQMRDIAEWTDAEIPDGEFTRGWNSCLMPINAKAAAALSAYQSTKEKLK